MTIYQAIINRKMGGIIKHSHFWEIYENQFHHLQNEEINMLVIGVFNAGDLFSWRKYFKNSRIIGIDIDPYCKRFNDPTENVYIEIGDQSDKDFLLSINNKYGPFNIIIDDGSHENYATITSFKTLFPLLNNEGIYVIEDTYHSYWPDYSCDRDASTILNYPEGPKGGKQINIIKTKSEITSMEFLKQLTDKMNVAAYIDGSKESVEAGVNKVFREPDEYEKSIFSMTFYDNICFIHKLIRDGYNSYGKSEFIGHNNDVPEDENYE